MEPGMTAGTPPQDTGSPDAVETDPAALNSAEDLDEDRLKVDPLEAGMDPPERWSGADRFGTTPREESEGLDLDARLAEEEPDIAAVEAEEPEEPPEYADPADGLATDEPDLSVEYRGGEVESIGEPETPEAVRRGQSADDAGGSVAAAMRTPAEAE
jgi:hypothetical protein